MIRLTAAPLLYSFSQDPRVPNNPNPIYAIGSPQWNAAIAAGADPNPPGPLTMNPGAIVMPIVTPAAAPAALSSLTGLPWYYYAGGAAALLFLFGGKR